jgi:gas vesicle protein
MTTTSKIILGILGAAAAGVAIGMIAAPKKTKKLSEKLKSDITDWSDNLKDHLAKTIGAAEKKKKEVVGA